MRKKKKPSVVSWRHIGNGIYNHKSGRFTIELLAGVAYLHDAEVIPVAKYVFKDLNEAKNAYSKILRGITVVSSVEDPFKKLNEEALSLINKIDALLKQFDKSLV